MSILLYLALSKSSMNSNLGYNDFQTVCTILAARSAEKKNWPTRKVALYFCHIKVVENLCYDDPESMEGWKYGHASSSCFLIGLFI